MNDNINFFWQRGTKEFLINCENNNTILADITRKTGMQHAHITKLAKKLEAINLIVRNAKEGRCKTLLLTAKGIEIRDLFKVIDEKMKEKQEELKKNGNNKTMEAQNGDTSKGNNDSE